MEYVRIQTSNNLSFVESTEKTESHCLKLLMPHANIDCRENGLSQAKRISDRIHGITKCRRLRASSFRKVFSLATILLLDAMRTKSASTVRTQDGRNNSPL